MWGKTQSGYKYHKLKAVTWNNLYCKGISAIREGNKSKLYSHFLSFRPRIRFTCEKGCRKRNDAIRLPLQFRFGFGVYVKGPLIARKINLFFLCGSLDTCDVVTVLQCCTQHHRLSHKVQNCQCRKVYCCNKLI